MGRVNRDALAADQAGGTSDERVPAPPLLYSPVNSNKWYSHRVGPSGSSRPNTSSWPPAYGSATYGCAACCSWVPTSFSLFYDPLGIPVGDGVPQGVEGFDGCELQYEDATYLFESGWSTANPSIATVDTHGLHTGMGVGSTTTLVTSEPIEVQIPHNTHCFLEQRSVEGNDNITPNIASISPAQGLIGTTVYVTIIGSGFGSSPTVNPGTGIGVTINYVSGDGTEIQANFQIFATATGGNQPATVTNGNQTSNAVNFFVQIPTSLSIVPGTDSTTAESGCTTSGQQSGCGVTRTFLYQVNDQSGQPIRVANMAFGDVICTTSTNQLNLTGYQTTCGGTTGSCSGTSGPCGAFTDANGQFTETLLVCAPACKPSGTCTTAGQTVSNQTWYINGRALSSDIKSLSYQCNKILVNGA